MTSATMAAIRLQVQQLREARGWSQSELARRSGVPQRTISRVERGETGSVNLSHIEKLADALGVNASALILHVPARAPGGARGHAR
jgi:transcriptional regulator with XRE-family HTH domain